MKFCKDCKNIVMPEFSYCICDNKKQYNNDSELIEYLEKEKEIEEKDIIKEKMHVEYIVNIFKLGINDESFILFEKALEKLLNNYQIDNYLGIADYILKDYLVNCLYNLENTTQLIFTKHGERKN